MKYRYVVLFVIMVASISVVGAELLSQDRSEFEDKWDMCEEFRDTGDDNRLYTRCLDENSIWVGETRDEYADRQKNKDVGAGIAVSVILGFVATAGVYGWRNEW